MIDLQAVVDQAFVQVRASIREGRIPGAVLGVVRADGKRASCSDGLAQRVPVAVPMRPQTWFDLASLTKVIFTTCAILRLVDEGRIGLDQSLSDAIPDLRQYDPKATERRLTLRQCLTHQTHLPAVEPLYTLGQDPATLRAYVLQRAWLPGPPVYSDINFILLGIVIERLTGRPLGEQAVGHGFSFKPDPALCAATEACSWRGRVMRGEVHDENAFALGGASGHAGLFGSMDAVLEFAHGLMSGAVLSPAGVAAIRSPASATRTVGWERRHDGWSGGSLCSAQTLGHTGFTGTGLWIDWERGLAWSLLTNRVHPTRHSESGIVELRRSVGNAVVLATG